MEFETLLFLLERALGRTLSETEWHAHTSVADVIRLVATGTAT
ncbi:unnamed protein product [Gemmataceae bacterium]|nr:unnamed protein product [Gemmataceae bacterium]VTT97457.1 unnamed protein product [Gemmataceae bacterium]